jgi:hypothetical protein
MDALPALLGLFVISLIAGTFLPFLPASSETAMPMGRAVPQEWLMDTFDHLLNWKLKVGSHRFPGKNGGTCINEAALVAAGFEYKPITSVHQMPECFSRPICDFALHLNDCARNAERQKLLPYVTRLACADTREVENARATYIHRRTYHYRNRIPIEVGLEVLEGALAIGRQADPLGPEDVKTRMDEVRTKAALPSVPDRAPAASDTPFLTKVKSWLTMKEIEPLG